MRKVKDVVLQDGDNEYRFRIRQMSATKQEKFIFQVILLLAGSGIEVPGTEGKQVSAEDIQSHPERYLNVQTLAHMLGSLTIDKVEPLSNELLACCSRVTDNMEEPCTPNTVDGYISDFRTLLKLKYEALKLNFSFFSDAAPSQTVAESSKPPQISITKKRKTSRP